MQVRVGQGFDIHRFSDDASRPLVLGGVVFDGERGLANAPTAAGDKGQRERESPDHVPEDLVIPDHGIRPASAEADGGACLEREADNAWRRRRLQPQFI
mgnify:CR=1 FL=1